MFKIFLIGLGTGYIAFTKNGHDVVKKYMELSNTIANKGLETINSIIPKSEDDKDEQISDE